VDVIVYVETNFLMSVAMGREGRGDDLLAAVSASVRVAIPSGCYYAGMEEDHKYQPDAPAREKPADPRWRVGLVSARARIFLAGVIYGVVLGF